jgi:hypothetical protein
MNEKYVFFVSMIKLKLFLNTLTLSNLE